MKLSFPKKEKLKSEKIIQRLFTEGKHLFKYPIKLVYLSPSDVSMPAQIQIAVSVPKKRFKKAVDRNTLKRRMREGVRAHKHYLDKCKIDPSTYVGIMLIYVSSDKENSRKIHRTIEHLFSLLPAHLTQNIEKDERLET